MQSELGLISSLLLGEQVMLSENQSFDSIVFVRLSARLLGDPASWAPANRPLALKLPPWRTSYETYRAMIADRLSAGARTTYYLSSPEIPRDKGALIELSALVGSGEWEKIVSRGLLREDAATAFHRLDAYFGQGPLPKSKGPTKTLLSYVQDLLALRNDEIESIVPERLVDRAIRLRTVLAGFPVWFQEHHPDHADATTPYRARTPFHTFGREFVRQHAAGSDFVVGTTFLDTCYNRVNADSMGVPNISFAPNGVVDDDPAVRIGAEIAEWLTHEPASHAVPELFGVPDLLDTTRVDWSALWQDVGMILRDEDFTRERDQIRGRFQPYDDGVQRGVSDSIAAYALRGRRELFHALVELVHQRLHKSPLKLRFDNENSSIWTELEFPAEEPSDLVDAAHAAAKGSAWQMVKLVPGVGQLADVAELSFDIARPFIDRRRRRRQAERDEIHCGWQSVLRSQSRPAST